MVHTFHKTRAIVPVLGVAVAAGLAAWASANIPWISSQIKTQTGAPAPVHVHSQGQPPASPAHLVVVIHHQGVLAFSRSRAA